MSVLIVILILVFLIVIHELGHFTIAKISGVEVEEFGIGYPPRAFSLGKWGGTEYTINWIPFGGFVRLLGEDGKEDLSRPEMRRSFAGAAKWKQALILLAGVAGNALAAWFLFTTAFAMGTPAQVPDGTLGARVVVSSVIENSPADTAGIEAGDTIKSIIAEDGKGLSEFAPAAVAEFVSQYGGKPLLFTYERTRIDESGAQVVTDNVATVTPAHGVLPNSSGRPALGIAMVSISDDKMPLSQAIVQGARYSVAVLDDVAKALWKLAKDAVVGQADIAGIVGPVGLVGVVGETTPYGAGRLFALAGFISMNLVIINLLPIPALDGGRLVIIGAEALIRRPLPEIAVRVINTLGFALIILLMFFVTYNDIARLIS